MNYYERHIGDYLKDTAHLSLLEHGIYTRLMDVYYTREGAIPQADAARLIGARSKDEREALKAVLDEFFVLVDGAHAQARCDREIARFQDKQTKAKRSANARWSAKPTHSEGNADAMRTHSEGNATRAPVPTPQSPEEEKRASEPDGSAVPAGISDRERVFTLGVGLLGEGGRAYLARLAKDHGEPVLAAVLAEAVLNPPIDPKSWLTAACLARAKPRTNGHHAEDGVLAGDPKPAWAINAGFPDRFQAENAGCKPGNARKFRNGQRVES